MWRFLLQLVYDVSKLIASSRELENVIDAKKFSEAYEVSAGSVHQSILITNKFFNIIFWF